MEKLESIIINRVNTLLILSVKTFVCTDVCSLPCDLKVVSLNRHAKMAQYYNLFFYIWFQKLEFCLLCFNFLGTSFDNPVCFFLSNLSNDLVGLVKLRIFCNLKKFKGIEWPETLFNVEDNLKKNYLNLKILSFLFNKDIQ